MFSFKKSARRKFFTVLCIVLLHHQIMAKRFFVLKSTDYKEIKFDLPSHKNFGIYLSSLEQILYFSDVTKLDLNYQFGLFLINVNLYSLSRQYKNPYIKYILKNIVAKTGVILKKRNTEATTEQPGLYTGEIEQSLLSLIDNYKKWSNRLEKFNLDLFQKGLNNNLHWDGLNLYPDWQSFLGYISHDSVPNPVHSDECLLKIAKNRDVGGSYESNKCKMSDECVEYLNDGSDFGYALTHRRISVDRLELVGATRWDPQETDDTIRDPCFMLPDRGSQELAIHFGSSGVDPPNERLLWLIAAKMSRGCYLVSPKEDQELRERFCETMYIESQYIAANSFKLPDLMLEQIALCSLDGHAHFLRTTWLENLLKFQTPEGCFGTKKYENTSPRTDHTEADDESCHEHVTAVAAATIAAAIRYIIESDSSNDTFIHY